MGSFPFPEFIRRLPEPDRPVGDMDAYLLPAPEALAMLYEVPAEGMDVPEHAHGAQWGVVLLGSVEFTIDGTVRRYERGDTYSVEAGQPHSARLSPGYVGIDVFADADRYQPRPRGQGTVNDPA